MKDSLVPLRIGDIAVGKPLPWPVYGPNKTLLLREGYVIETQRQLEVLVKDGLYRGSSWSAFPSARARSAAPVEQKGAEEGEARSFSFEELKPRVGDAIQLQIKEERYPVKLMGYVKGVTIMVSTPVADGGVMLLREGQPVVVRSFSGKDAYAFSSSILRVCNAPLPYLHLAYPKAVQSVAVRKTVRADFNLVGAVMNTSNPDMAASRAVRICDLSISGASFTVGDLVGDKGDTLSLSFRVKLNELDASLAASCIVPTVNCVVRSVISESEIGSTEAKFRYGVQFTEVPTDVSLLLQNMIYQKLLEHA
jgi:c-di-GMP-binding flagellar brake protein YcgR